MISSNPVLPPLAMDTSHVEEIYQTFMNMTSSPVKNLINHFIPSLGAVTHRGIEIKRDDETQESMMPLRICRSIFQEIQLLSEAAFLSREPLIYTALSHNFSSYGGSLSLTRPILFIPHQHLFRQGKNPFTQETPEDRLSENLWNFSDDEIRFLISRLMGDVKENGIYRIAIKTALFVFLFFAYGLPLSFCSGIGMGLAVGCIYLSAERIFEAKNDRAGLKILKNRLGDEARAKKAALNALNKMKQANLFRRTNNLLCRLYISREGNNWLDLTHPSIHTRIENLS